MRLWASYALQLPSTSWSWRWQVSGRDTFVAFLLWKLQPGDHEALVKRVKVMMLRLVPGP